MTDWKSSLRATPIEWLLENACAPIRYRVLTELLDLPRDDLRVREVYLEMHAYPEALKLAKSQKNDGGWGRQIHAADPKKFEVCTENAVWNLFEMGWDRETKTIKNAAKLLRSYLTAKKDLKFFEFGKVVKADERREVYYRWFLKIMASGLLVRAGYLDDRARVRVLELLQRVSSFVEAPIARNPVEEIGAAHPLIRSQAWRDGYPFIPDYYTTMIFSHSPWLLGGELAKIRLRKIFDYVMSPMYQALAPDLGLVRTSKGTFIRGYGLKFHPIDHYRETGTLDALLVQIEMMARLGLVNRYPVLMSALEWLVAQQGKDGRWSLPAKLWSDNSRWSNLLRIEKDWRSPVRKDADITFRILLIMKHQWERQILMLDRRDDGYPI
jgi:hypothetical protein